MSRDEILARYPGARWREVNDEDRAWCARVGHSVPLGYIAVDVTVRRVSDGVERTVIESGGFMVEQEGDDAIYEALDAAGYWWVEGNGGCESNLVRFFARAGGDPEPDWDGPHRCEQVEYRLVAPDWLAHD